MQVSESYDVQAKEGRYSSLKLIKPLVENGVLTKGYLPEMGKHLALDGLVYSIIKEYNLDESEKDNIKKLFVNGSDNDRHKFLHKLTKYTHDDYGINYLYRNISYLHDSKEGLTYSTFTEIFRDQLLLANTIPLNMFVMRNTNVDMIILESSVMDYIDCYTGEGSPLGKKLYIDDFTRPTRLHYHMAMCGFDPYWAYTTLSVELEDGSPVTEEYLNSEYGTQDKKIAYKLKLSDYKDEYGNPFKEFGDDEGEYTLLTNTVTLLEEFLNPVVGGYRPIAFVWKKKGDILSGEYDSNQGHLIWPIEQDVLDVEAIRIGDCINGLLKLTHHDYFDHTGGIDNTEFYEGFKGNNSDIPDELYRNRRVMEIGRLIYPKTDNSDDLTLVISEAETNFVYKDYLPKDRDGRVPHTVKPSRTERRDTSCKILPFDGVYTSLMFPRHPDLNHYYKSFDNSNNTVWDKPDLVDVEHRYYGSEKPADDIYYSAHPPFRCSTLKLIPTKVRVNNGKTFNPEGYTLDRSGLSNIYVMLPNNSYKLLRFGSYLGEAMYTGNRPVLNSKYTTDGRWPAHHPYNGKDFMLYGAELFPIVDFTSYSQGYGFGININIHQDEAAKVKNVDFIRKMVSMYLDIPEDTVTVTDKGGNSRNYKLMEEELYHHYVYHVSSGPNAIVLNTHTGVVLPQHISDVLDWHASFAFNVSVNVKYGSEHRYGDLDDFYITQEEFDNEAQEYVDYLTGLHEDGSGNLTRD